LCNLLESQFLCLAFPTSSGNKIAFASRGMFFAD
jgi:hypothetical protein